MAAQPRPPIVISSLPPTSGAPPPATFSNANFPTDHEGRTYHVGTRKGEVANRIVTVGDPARLRVLVSLLDDNGQGAHAIVSKRGFTTVTGKFEGVDVSIVAIGMGFPMMDMLVRELRATTDGSLLIARFGSCGGVGEKAEVGTVVVAREGAVMIQRNWDFFASNYDGHDSVESDDPELEKRAWESGKPPYRISGVCPADAELSEVLLDRLRSQLGESRVHAGLNATADSFYSSQGRTDPSFYDFNHNLLTRLPSLIPNVETLEMETFALLHLAKCARASDSVATVGGGAANEGHVVGNVARAESLSSRTGGRRIRATACAMVFADRKGNAFIEPHDVVRLEKSAGRAVLEAVTQCSIE